MAYQPTTSGVNTQPATGIDYTQYKGMTPSQLYGTHPNGLPEGWDWSQFDKVNGTNFSTAASLPGWQNDWRQNGSGNLYYNGQLMNSYGPPDNRPNNSTLPNLALPNMKFGTSFYDPTNTTAQFNGGVQSTPNLSAGLSAGLSGLNHPSAGITNPIARNGTPPPPPQPTNNTVPQGGPKSGAEGTTPANTQPTQPQGTTVQIPGMQGSASYSVPAGSDPNKLFGQYYDNVQKTNAGSYTGADGNPTTDPNWLNNQNLPDWLKSQYYWNPGDSSIGGGTPAHWDFKYTDGTGMKDANGNTVYSVGGLMNDPQKYFKDSSKIYYDPNLGWVTQDHNAVDWSATQHNSWHSGDYIAAGSIILGGLANGYLDGSLLGGSAAPSLTDGTLSMPGGEGTAGGFGTTGATGGLGPPGGLSGVGPGGGAGGTTTYSTGPDGHQVVTYHPNQPGPPANGVGATPTPPPTGGTTGGQQPPPPNNTTNTTNTNTSGNTNTNTNTTTNNTTKPSWFPGDQDTWNMLTKMYNGLGLAAKGIGLYNFVSALTGGHPLSLGNNTPGGTGPGNNNNNNNGSPGNSLLDGALAWGLDQNLINTWKDQFNSMYNKGDYNSAYRPDEISQLHDLLTDPSKVLNDPAYMNFRNQQLDNESRALASRGFNISGNEEGDLLKYGTNLDFQHINDMAKNLTGAAQLGNPDAMARAGINSLPFMLGMMSNRNNDITSALGRSGGVSGILNKIFGSKGPPTDSSGNFDFSQFTSDQLNNFMSYGMPDPNQDPQGAQTWMQQFTTGQIQVPGLTDTTDLPGSVGNPPDGFDSWDAYFAWLMEGGTPDGTGAGP